MTPCPPEEQLLAHADGAPVPPEVLAHFRECTTCRSTLETIGELRAFPASLDVEGGVAAVMQNIGTPRRSWAPLLAAAAILALLPVGWALRHGADTFTPRGSSIDAGAWLRRSVGVEVRRAEAPASPLSSGGTARADTRWLVVTRNTDAHRDGHALVFAVDSGGQVHWLYPAHADEATNESSLRVAAGTSERPAEDLVALESPSLGAATFFVVLSEGPLHVKDVEALGAEALSPERLRAHFPEAEIQATQVTLTP